MALSRKRPSPTAPALRPRTALSPSTNPGSDDFNPAVQRSPAARPRHALRQRIPSPSLRRAARCTPCSPGPPVYLLAGRLLHEHAQHPVLHPHPGYTPAARHPQVPGRLHGAGQSKPIRTHSAATALAPEGPRGNLPPLTGRRLGSCSSTPGRVTSSVTLGVTARCHASRVHALTCVETGITVFRWYERDSVTVGPNTIHDAEAPCSPVPSNLDRVPSNLDEHEVRAIEV